MVKELIIVAAIIVGFAIGFWFGTNQNSALVKNKKKYENGKLKNGFFIMPSSMGRISILLIILVVIQLAIPMFFQGNIQWIVSAGIILGYGWTFVKQLRNHTVYHG
jgi:hypothetical protein